MAVLGIDIGGTRIKAGLVDESGGLLSSTAVPTPLQPDAFQCALGEIFAKLLGGDQDLAVVGIGCKGIIEPETTRVAILPGTLHFLEGKFLSSLVEPFLREVVPIRADNDARAALAGEVVWGAARGRRNALMLTLGTGVGGAVLADGRILRGSVGAAGHLGHLTVDPDGPVCICGNRGCLETVFSARAIEAQAIAAILRGCDSELRRCDPLAVTCETVFALAARGDEVACAIRDRSLKYLAGAMAGLLSAFDPEIVIVAGQIAAAGVALFDPLRREVTARTRRLLGREVPILPAQVAGEPGVIGAAALQFL